jgi:hypothetical protein
LQVAYKEFIAETVPDGLLVRQYNIVERVRAMKLLTVTAESGLLEALEAKGLTLSQVEKLLPLADDLGLLSLAYKNKGLLIAAAPLLLEPAPLLLPILANIVRTPASTFSGIGFALLAAGGFEIVDSNSFLGALLVLLAGPAVLLGSALSGSLPLPSAGAARNSASADTFAPSVQSGNRPAAKASTSAQTVSNRQNGKRKVVRVR